MEQLLLAVERMPKKRTPTVKRAPKANRSDVLAQLLLEREREILVEYLAKHGGNISATAEALGLSRRALENKITLHDLRAEAGALRAESGTRGPRSGL